MMDRDTQAQAAEAMRATGYSWYRQVTVRGNVAELERIPWETALVLIQRGQCKGWLLARDERPRHLSLVEDGDYLAANAESRGPRP